MSNATALKTGTAKAKSIMESHICNILLPDMAQTLLNEAIEGRIFLGHNMTGNTINSYAAGIYAKGKLTEIYTPSGRIPAPLRKKLGLGQRFHAGSQRWDGEMQEHTFIASTGTNGAMEPNQSIAFLQSYQASSNGYVIVVCNGIEYATFQENLMDIDVLTANYQSAIMLAPTMIKPMTD